MRTLDGCILTPDGFVEGSLSITPEGRIAAIEGRPLDAAPGRESKLALLLPGFIDLHVHGGAGRDIMEGGDAARAVARRHAAHGTTALLATTMTAPLQDLQQALAGVGPLCRGAPDGGARILGVHLEGPYINAGKLGAQPDFARPVSLDEVRALDALAPVRLLTLAPEVPGHLEAIEALCSAGFRVQLGHTLGGYEDGVEALARGARGFTHLFNAMTPLHHRLPGMVGAALAHAQYAELIPDLLHVHPGAIRVALRSIPHLYCVTDSTAATGMPDGEYKLGRQPVTKCLGGVRLADGTLAGSTLTMDRALRNLVQVIGLPLEDAARRVSTYAADFLGLDDRGRLRPGAWADVVQLDADLRVRQVHVKEKRSMSRMLDEAREAPQAVARQLAADGDRWRALGTLLRTQPPSALLTVARGSSDHAAHYAAYLVMARLGKLVTSMPMSLVTLYQSRIACAGLASFAFSQSGQSPDLVGPTRYFRDGGAITCAFVNDAGSPLAEAAQWVFPLHAGEEKSVAATKSFIAQLVAGARLVAAWQDDDALLRALAALPGTLEKASRCDWTPAVQALRQADRLFVVGRGLGLPVALEAALKFKETCGIQAEAFSGAEIQHGPMALIEEGYPLLVFAPRGPAQGGLLDLARAMRGRGARVLLAAPPGTPDADLPLVDSALPELDAVSAIQSFYPMVEALARARGFDPDRPPHLNKVTRTR